MTDQEIRLQFGEMNAGEMRLARALVAWHERECAKLKEDLTHAERWRDKLDTKLTEVVEAAERAGWYGVENSKNLPTFITYLAEALSKAQAELAAVKGEGQPVVVNEPPQDEKQPDLSGEREKQAHPWTPAVGDVVRLKSGGPAMTVTNVDPLSLMCAWMNASNELQVEPITTLCLTPAQP